MDYCREDGPREGFFNLRVGPSQWQWRDREVTLAVYLSHWLTMHVNAFTAVCKKVTAVNVRYVEEGKGPQSTWRVQVS